MHDHRGIVADRPAAAGPLVLLTGSLLLAALAGCGEGGSGAAPPAAAGGSGSRTATPAATTAGGSADAPSPDAGSASAAASPSAAAPGPIEVTPVAPPRPAAAGPGLRPLPGADLPDTAAAAVPGAGPQLVAEQAIHDFGEIFDGRTVTAEFAFRNAGDQPLEIAKISTSCGCTAADLDRMVFGPGEGDVIRVNYTPKGVGRQNQRVTVISNDPDQPRAEFRITAIVEPFLKTSSKFLRWEDLGLGEGGEQVLTVDPVDPGFRFDELVIDGQAPEWFEAELLPAESAVAGPFRPGQAPVTEAGRRIRVRVKPETPWGGVYANLRIRGEGRASDDAPYREHVVTIPLHARVYGELEGSRPMITINRVDPGASYRREITIKRRSGEPFEITSARLVESAFAGTRLEAVPVDGSDRSEWRIIASGESGSYRGPLLGLAEITTDLQGPESVLYIRVTGIVQPLERSN